MLRLMGDGEVVAVAPRVEYHGDDIEPAVTIRLRFTDVPLDVVVDAFCAQLSLFYGGAGQEPRLPELEPLQVSRAIDNVRASVAGVTLTKMRCDKVKLTPRAGRVVEVDLKLKGRIDGGLDELHHAMCEQNVPCELIEQQEERLRVVND